MLDVLKSTYASQIQSHEVGLEVLKKDRSEKETSLMTMSQKLFKTVQIHDPRPSKLAAVLTIIVQVAAVLLVAYGEWPFNAVSFQVLGLSDQQCNYVALAIGAVMGFLAFGAGYSSKKGWVTGTMKWWGLSIFLLLVSIGGIYTLSIMRTEFLQKNAEDGTTMLNPATQTALTYMIFIGGVMVEFFCSKVYEFPEEFSAYCKTYVEYEKILGKIQLAEDAIQQLNQKMQSDLSKESELIVAKAKLEHSREVKNLDLFPVKEPVAKSNPVLVPIPSVKPIAPLSIPKDFFKKKYESWLTENKNIENELDELKVNPKFVTSYLSERIILQQSNVVVLDELVKREDPDVQSWWRERKEQFSNLVKRVENEIK